MYKCQIFYDTMTTVNEEWTSDTGNHVSNVWLIYPEMDFFQHIYFLIISFSIMSHNDYIHMNDFTSLP